MLEKKIATFLVLSSHSNGMNSDRIHVRKTTAWAGNSVRILCNFLWLHNSYVKKNIRIADFTLAACLTTMPATNAHKKEDRSMAAHDPDMLHHVHLHCSTSLRSLRLWMNANHDPCHRHLNAGRKLILQHVVLLICYMNEFQYSIYLFTDNYDGFTEVVNSQFSLKNEGPFQV